MGLPLEMQRHLAAENVRRPVSLVVVREGSAAAHRMLHVRETRRRLVVLIVAATDAKRDAIALRHRDAGRPDLDVELDHFAGLERLLLVVRVIGTVGPRQLAVELAVRGAAPPLADGRLWIERALEQHFVAARLEDAPQDNEIS